MKEIKQIVPPEFCLKCHVCCRFLDKNSSWRPVLTRAEKNQHKNLAFDRENKITLIPHEGAFICPCFTPRGNQCKIYSLRPFDCKLYPFLLFKKNRRAYLGLDEKCSYIKLIFKDQDKMGLIEEAKKELTSAPMISWFKENPDLFCNYEQDTLEIAYLFEENEFKTA